MMDITKNLTRISNDFDSLIHEEKETIDDMLTTIKSIGNFMISFDNDDDNMINRAILFDDDCMEYDYIKCIEVYDDTLYIDTIDDVRFRISYGVFVDFFSYMNIVRLVSDNISLILEQQKGKE